MKDQPGKKIEKYKNHIGKAICPMFDVSNQLDVRKKIWFPCHFFSSPLIFSLIVYERFFQFITSNFRKWKMIEGLGDTENHYRLISDDIDLERTLIWNVPDLMQGWTFHNSIWAIVELDHQQETKVKMNYACLL